MYTVLQDNKDILRYRGLLYPAESLLEAQKEAFRLALLQVGDLSTNAIGRFTEGKTQDPNKVTSTNPYMRLLPPSGGHSDNTVYDFYFPFLPQGIDYSDLSDEIAEIQRAGTTPIVTFRGHRLMKVSMEFLVAVPYDGIFLDIEESLQILRIFSTYSNRSVVFYHLDRNLTRGYNYRLGPYARPPAFNITEMSINARQRNADGKITQAIIRLSLVENRNPDIVVTRVPPFRKKKPKKRIPAPVRPPRPARIEPYTATAALIPISFVNP
jgi:hypothetical protein